MTAVKINEYTLKICDLKLGGKFGNISIDGNPVFGKSFPAGTSDEEIIEHFQKRIGGEK